MTQTLEYRNVEGQPVSLGPVSDFEIEHPARPGWTPPDLRGTKKMVCSNIGRRFAGAIRNVGPLIEAAETAVIRSELHRYSHERDNYGRLEATDGETETYLGLAGEPESVGEFIYFLGELAHLSLDCLDEGSKVGSISLDLGGKLQYGDWESTGPLDAMARDIPRQLRQIKAATVVKTYDGNKPKANKDQSENLHAEPTPENYLLMPTYLQDPDNGRPFDYALLRRRRAVADISIPYLRPIEVYKDSTALVVVSQMEPDIQEKLYSNYPIGGLITEAKKNSPPALLAGAVFERAIIEEKGITLDIVPIGAHYVMKMFKDGRSIAKPSEE